MRYDSYKEYGIWSLIPTSTGGNSTYPKGGVSCFKDSYNDRPIYDNEVVKVFAFNPPRQSSTFNEKLDIYLNRLSIIEQTYNSINVNNRLQNIQNIFNNKFPLNDLGQVKKLDFIFWSTGKLLRH